MIRIAKQISVFLENRPGLMARITGILAEGQMNISALSVHDTVDHAVVRLVVDQHIKAVLLLERQGLYITENDVAVVDLFNRPGALTHVARALAHADINIQYAYCTATDGQGQGSLVLKTDNIERTLDVLSKLEW
ncbi:MAG: ACT domain-containing protein [Candidatus Omnitrophica bacterium]|nr:ACT domain-containing protein [Candidatus Omnitrophota bacterium]